MLRHRYNLSVCCFSARLAFPETLIPSFTKPNLLAVFLIQFGDHSLKGTFYPKLDARTFAFHKTLEFIASPENFSANSLWDFQKSVLCKMPESFQRLLFKMPPQVDQGIGVAHVNFIHWQQSF